MLYWSMQMTISTLNLLTPWLQSVHTFNNPYTGARLHGEAARSISPTKHNASQFTSDIMESSSCTKKRNDSLCEHKYGKRSNSLKQGHLSCKTFCNSIDMYFNVKLVQIAWKKKNFLGDLQNMYPSGFDIIIIFVTVQWNLHWPGR